MGLYGGGVAVLTAKHPLGPWTNVTSTLDPGCPMEKQTTCFEMGPGAVCNPVTQAQQNYVISVPLANGSTAYVWTGAFDSPHFLKLFEQTVWNVGQVTSGSSRRT